VADTQSIVIGSGLVFGAINTLIALWTRLAVAELKASLAEKCAKCEDRFVSRREIGLLQLPQGATHGQS
jgi:hypothetical protein